MAATSGQFYGLTQCLREGWLGWWSPPGAERPGEPDACRSWYSGSQDFRSASVPRPGTARVSAARVGSPLARRQALISAAM